MNPRFDHFLTFANTGNIDDFVEKYRALGFVVSNETRRYKPGLRNRFVSLGCEYLEIVWVENEDEFARGSPGEFGRMFNNLPELRSAARPFSIGFLSEEVEKLHREWTQRGYDIPPVWSFAPPGKPPILSFQVIPFELLPGASCFAITYHNSAPSDVKPVERAANTVYAVEGVTFVSNAPEDDANRWKALLFPDQEVKNEQMVYSAAVPPHITWWMFPETYQNHFNIAWKPAHHRHGHLAAIHLLAEDLEIAQSMLGQHFIKQIVSQEKGNILVDSPTGEDGVIFLIREFPIELWRSERSNVTGERIVIS
jgi:hypothetical protein